MNRLEKAQSEEDRPEGIRLQKFLADAGAASRRKAEKLITAGRVSVNGQTVRELGVKISPSRDTVCLDGEVINVNQKLFYIILHKPEGVITSVTDPYNRPVVLDFVKNIPARLFPVGRLDYDSSGLLLLTNDGKLAQVLTHPRHAVSKTYIAHLRETPKNRDLQAFRSGLILDDGHKTASAKIKILSKKKDGCTVEITIREGRNRQIRKMCEAIGCPVMMLKRISMGPVKLGDLPRGKYRRLTEVEVAKLKSL